MTVLSAGLLLASEGDLSGYLSTFGGIKFQGLAGLVDVREYVPGYESDAAMRR